MSFLSAEFTLALALVVLAFHATPSKWRAHLLLGFSYLFYASWSLWHTALLLGITSMVYVAALSIDRCTVEQRKFRIVLLAACLLLLLLAVFKFGIDVLDLLHVPGGGTLGMTTMLVAPLGLSYYLFRLMGYLLDVYWEKNRAERNFLSLALYTSFFPQIVCGPIQRADVFFKQLPKLAQPDESDLTEGLRRILLGLVKKVVIADRFGLLVGNIHANLPASSPVDLLIGAYGFALQLYFDFSGLTDIALGMGRLFGIRGPENFQFPFLAPNVQEFWRRWHMSLTSWLSDYLFLPLRMSLRGFGDAGLATAVFVNMVAVGVWHGSKLTFAVFGVLNGIFLVVSVFTLKKRDKFFKQRPALRPARSLIGPLVTFHLFAFSLIFFRADSLGTAMAYLKGLVAVGGVGGTIHWGMIGSSWARLGALVAVASAMELIEWQIRKGPWEPALLKAPRAVRWAIYYAGIAIIIYSFGGTRDFIYAQF